MFKVGDEVECVDDGPMHTPGYANHGRRVSLVAGKKYVVREVFVSPVSGNSGVMLDDPETVWFTKQGPEGGYKSARFRKVQKRNDCLSIESFMTMPGGFEEPRRPAKTKEKKDA